MVGFNLELLEVDDCNALEFPMELPPTRRVTIGPWEPAATGGILYEGFHQPKKKRHSREVPFADLPREI